jgi:hypothetical protein
MALKYDDVVVERFEVLDCADPGRTLEKIKDRQEPAEKEKKSMRPFSSNSKRGL